MLRTPLEGDDQNNREDSEAEYAVRIPEPVTADRKHSRDKFIFGQIDRQQRKCGIPRIRRQDQN
ncbi:hypothetical protein D3C75_1094860 [compost metagenome]